MHGPGPPTLLTSVTERKTTFAMSPNEIRAALILRGIRQTDIARSLGLTRYTVCNVIGGYRTSRRVKQKIADTLELPVHKVFPERAKLAA